MQKLLEPTTGGVICVYGRSNSGKTSSCRNLPPANTFWITTETQQTANALRGWGWQEWNYDSVDAFFAAKNLLENVGKDRSIKYVVVDTFSALVETFLDEYCQDAGKSLRSECGYGLYNAVGDRAQQIIKLCTKLADGGKWVVLLCHLDYKETNEGGAPIQMQRPALFGKMPEYLSSKIPVILRAEVLRMGRDLEYSLEIGGGQGCYGGDKTRILSPSEPNDIMEVIRKLRAGVDTPSTTQSKDNSPTDSTTSLPAKPSLQSTPATLPTPGPSTKQLTDEIYQFAGEKLRKERGEVQLYVRNHYGVPITKMDKDQLAAVLEEFQAQYDPSMEEVPW